MQRKKLLVACLSLLLAATFLPTFSIPSAHAFDQTTTITLSGIGVRGFTDPQTGATVDAISSGSTLSVTVAILASNFQPSYQRNITIGFEGDWMTHYQNASNASPASTLALVSSQQASVTLSIAVPSNAGLTAYTWSVAVWDGAANVQNNAVCFAGNNGENNNPGSKSCDLWSNGRAGYNSLAVYTGDQLSAAQAAVPANNAIMVLDSELQYVASASLNNKPGTASFIGQLTQAKTEQALAANSWKNGDYAGAKTHYQNALNDANGAASALTSQGGGVDTASLLNLLLGGAGVAMIGIGGLLAGIGAFSYLRKKPKA